MIDRNTINPSNYKQEEGTCIFWTFALILKALANRDVLSTFKGILTDLKTISLDESTISEIEKRLYDEVYNTNPIQKDGVIINHAFLMKYFYKHLYPSIPYIELSMLSVGKGIDFIEDTLKSKKSLMSMALHQNDVFGIQSTHIVTVGFDTEFYIIDTRDASCHKLGSTLRMLNMVVKSHICYPSSLFTIGDGLLAVLDDSFESTTQSQSETSQTQNTESEPPQ